jgi:TorA maturation chaperone TorD
VSAVTRGSELLATLGALRDCFSDPPDRDLVSRLQLLARSQPAWQPCAQAALAEPPDRLAAEWMRLFDGPGRIPVPLFGSFYLDDGLLMGPSTLAVGEAYRRHQLVPKAAGVPPDHLAYELGFLGLLVSEDGPTARAELAAFARRYMGWLPTLERALQGATAIAFFQELGALAHRVVEDLAAGGALDGEPPRAAAAR